MGGRGRWSLSREDCAGERELGSVAWECSASWREAERTRSGYCWSKTQPRVTSSRGECGLTCFSLEFGVGEEQARERVSPCRLVRYYVPYNALNQIQENGNGNELSLVQRSLLPPPYSTNAFREFERELFQAQRETSSATTELPGLADAAAFLRSLLASSTSALDSYSTTTTPVGTPPPESTPSPILSPYSFPANHDSALLSKTTTTSTRNSSPLPMPPPPIIQHSAAFAEDIVELTSSGVKSYAVVTVRCSSLLSPRGAAQAHPLPRHSAAGPMSRVPKLPQKRHDSVSPSLPYVSLSDLARTDSLTLSSPARPRPTRSPPPQRHPHRSLRSGRPDRRPRVSDGRHRTRCEWEGPSGDHHLPRDLCPAASSPRG